MNKNKLKELLLTDLKKPSYERDKDYFKDMYEKSNDKYWEYLMSFNNFHRIMLFFADKNRIHLEKFCHGFINNAYNWNATYFDVINSFWTIFKCALLISHPELGLWKENKNKTRYPIVVDGYYYLDAEKFADKFINNYFNKKYLDKIFNCLETYPKLEELASLTHCYANFMPCPDNYFNTSKGINNCADNLSLFVSLINDDKEIIYKLDNRTNEVPSCLKTDWKERLKENNQKYFLEDYYRVKDNELIINEMFKNQKEEIHPHNKEELKEYLNTIIRLIKNRADKMVQYLINENN